MHRFQSAAAVFLATGAALAWVDDAGADPVFTGPGVYESTRRSIDIVGTHLDFLQAQNANRDLFTYMGYTQRWAPGTYLLNDGRRFSGNLTRGQFNLGLGFGSLEKFGVFGGATLDYVQPVNPFNDPIPHFPAGAAGQNLLFAGVSVFDVQATYGQMLNDVSPRAFALDPYGNFAGEGTNGRGLRPGAPAAIASPDAAPWRHRLFTFYENRSGASLSIIYADKHDAGATNGHSYQLSEVRANLQPLIHLLPREIGLPFLGITKLDPDKDYYQEAIGYKNLITQSTAGASPTANVPGSSGTPYELELGSDDILAGGFRLHVVQQLAPTVKFRRAELGYVEEFGRLQRGPSILVGARAQVYTRNDTMTLSAEAFVLGSILRHVEKKGVSGFWSNISIGASYSFNSPDAVTFLPIPNAHVFGVQLVFGKPETSRPLVPLVRAVQDRLHGRQAPEKKASAPPPEATPPEATPPKEAQ